MFCNKSRIELARNEVWVSKQGGLKGDVRIDTANHKTIERIPHLGNRIIAIAAMHNQFCNHRIVVNRDFTPLLNAGVYPHPKQVLCI